MTRLILIDSRISDVEGILATLTPETESIVFDYYTDTLDTIQSQIVKLYTSVAIAQHKYGNPTFQLVASMSPASLENLEETDPELASWSEFSAFVLWLKTNGADTVDLLACNLWSDMNWRYAIQKMRDTMNMTIRASIDITGADGNFILESDNVDMVGLYFTPEISNYKYNFGTNATVSPMDFGRSSTTMFVPVTLPTSNAGSVPATSYSAFIGSSSSSTGYSTITTDVSNVVSVCMSEKSVALLKGDGSVVTYGQITGADTGGNSSSVQSRLNNITKIVTTLDGFAALRSDGVVIPWGVYATSTDSTTYIRYRDISNTLVNITNIWSSDNAVIALNTSGKIITFGRKANGGQIPSGYVNYLNSGVIKVATSQTSQLYIKSDGTAYVITGTVGTNSLSTLYNTNPIVDGIMAKNFAVVIRSASGNTKQITNLDGSTLHYTIPSGVSIVKTLINNSNSVNLHVYILLSNNVLLILRASVTVVYNVTDVAINDQATAYIQNGSVVVTGNNSKPEYGTVTNDPTYGIPTGRTLTNIRRLVSSSNSLGALSFDGTFTWWGSIIEIISGITYDSKDFPKKNATTTQIYNKLTSNVASVYACSNGYVFTCLDGSMVSLGIESFQSLSSNKATTKFSTKNAGKNVYFVPNESGFVPVDITPVVTSSISPGEPLVNNTVTYYNSNPDVMALAGRKYTLYNGTTVLSTWYCDNNSFTYTFSDVVLSSGGSVSLSIYDSPDYTTNKSLIGTFNVTVNPAYSAPSAPISLVAVAGLNSATISFTSGSTNGSGSINSIQYSTNAGSNWTNFTGSYNDVSGSGTIALSYIVGGYSIVLRQGTANGGYSVASTSVQVTPYTNTTPSAPTLLTASAPAGSNSVSVTFTSGNTNGSGSINSIQYSTNAGSIWTDLSGTYNDVSGSGTIVLDYDSSYSIILRERTANGGYSVASNSLNTGILYRKPSAPTSLVAVAGLNSASISFTSGNTNGSGSINSIQYSTNAGSTWTDLSGTYNNVSGSGTIALPYTGSAYSIVLRESTINGGYSVASSSVSVTPYGNPSAPTNLFARKYKTSAYNGILISFTTNSTNGSGSMTNTQYLSSNAGSVWTDATFISVNGTNYIFVSLPYNSTLQTITLRQSSQLGGYSAPSSALDINNTGILESSFGTLGFTTTNFATGLKMNAMIFDLSKNIIICGTRESNFFISRYYPDGSLDTTFGTNGVTITDLFGFSDTGRCMAIDNSNNILVAGTGQITSGGIHIPAICRYKSNGSIDTTFGTNGKVSTEFIANTSCDIHAIKLTLDGRIVVGGSQTGGVQSIILARYTSSGALDQTFNSTGITVHTNGWQQLDSIHVYPDNSILIGGASIGGEWFMIVRRFTAAGQLDTTFNNNTGSIGIDVDTVEATKNDYITSMAVDSSGNIFLAGGSGNSAPGYNSTGNFTIAKITPSGTLDTTFSGDGRYLQDIGILDYISDIYINRNNKLVVVGCAGITSSITNFAVAMYNLDGTPYTAFSSTAYKLIAIPGFTSSLARAMLIDDNNDVLIGGAVFNESNVENMALIKYTDIVISPDCPAINTVSVLSDTLASITFTCGSTNGTGSITKLQYSMNNGSTWSDLSGTYNNISGNGTIILPSIKPENLSVTLRSYTVIGGYSSKSASYLIQYDAPSAPYNVAAVAGLNSVLISFTSGSTNLSGSINSIQYSTNAGSTWFDLSGSFNDVSGSGTIALSYIVGGYSIVLRQGTANGGYSVASTSVSVTPISSIPEPPRIDGATVVSKDITVNFTDASLNADREILGYKYSYDSGVTYTDLSANVRQFVLTNMTAPNYTIWLKAYNIFGDSSYNSQTVIMYGLPEPPTITGSQVVSNQVIILFTDNGANADRELLGYKYSYDGGVTYYTLDPTATQIILTNPTSPTYTIRLSAYNVVGETTYVQETVTVYGLPEPPTITSTEVASNQITVHFTDSSLNANRVILGYKYSTNSGVSYTDLSANVRQFVLTNMNDPSYNIWLKAYNSVGDSSYNSQNVIMYGAPSVPTITSIIAGSNSGLVTFTCGSTNGSGSIDKIQYSLDGSSTWIDLSGTFNDVSGSGTIPLPYRGSAYTVAIRQRTPYGGFSGSSNSVSVSPYSNTTSSSPSSLVATPGVNSASVTFTCGSTNGSGSIDKIQYSLDGSSTWIDLSGTFNDVSGSGTIPLPYRGSAYTVAIRQRTPYGGFSGSSNSVSVSPYSNTTPSASSSLAATPGVNSASVTFTTGSTNGSGSIDKIQYSLDGSSTWIDLSGTFNDVSGSGTIPLPYRGTAYTVAIRQRTPYGGFSGSSNSVSVSPYSNTTPSAPSSLVATPGVNSASVTFTTGSTNGSGSIDKIQYSLDGSSTWIDLSGTFNDVSGSGTIPLPYRGTAYTVAIRQRTPYGGFSGSSNSVSVSPYSNTTSSSPSSLVATPGVNSASVTFTCGSTNGSGSIDKIQYSLDGSSTWIDLSGTFNDVSGSGTIPLPYRGSAYTVAIRQRTPYGGFSGSSNSVSVSPYSNTTPSASSSLAATPGVNSASVTFTTGSTNGSGSIDKIQYSLDGSSTWIDLSGTFNDVSGSGTIPLPYRGTAYTVAIRQRTPYGGFSGSSNSVSVSPYSNTTPSAPSSLVATPGVNSASVTFTTGSTNGSGSIDKIQYSLDGSSTWIDLSGTFNDVSGSGTIPLPYRGTAYTVAIRQRTPYGGFSGSSNSVSVSPYSNTTPSAPSSLVATPGVNSASVTFTCGNTNGSGSIDKIQYSLDGSSTWIDLSGTFNDVSGSGTIPLPYRGTAYTVAIRQRTPYGGFSGSSNSVSVSPYSNTTPSAPSSLVSTPGVNSASVTFTTGSTNGSGSIDKIQYSLDGSSTWIDLSGTFNDVSGSGTIPLPYRGSAYTVAIRQRTPYGGFSGSSNSVSVSPYSNTTPSAPSSLVSTPGVNSASVTFTTGSTNGSGSIDKIQYSLDGSNWVDLSGTFNDVSGSGTIPLNYTGTAYTIVIRQSTPYGGFSGSSNSVSVSPYSNTTPSAPSSLAATPGVNSASVTFTCGSTNGSGSIDKIQYSLNGSDWLDLSGTFNDVSGSGTIPLPYRGSAYTVAIRQRTPYGGFSTSSNSVSVSPYSNTTPSAASSLAATPGVNSASVTFTTGSTNGSGSIDKIQYSLDGSSTWIDLSGTFNDVSGSGTIPLPYRGTAYTIAIRQRTPYGGFSGSSNSVSVSPYSNTTPSSPSSLAATPGVNSASVTFTCGNTNGSGSIDKIQYSLDGSSTWIDLSGTFNDVSGSGTIPLPYRGSAYTVVIRQRTPYGGFSTSSNSVSVSPYSNTTSSAASSLAATPGVNSASVTFTCGSTNGSGSIDKIQYSLDGSSTWIDLSGTFNDVSGSGTITLPYRGSAYTVAIRQRTPYGGFSGSSNSVSVSPYSNATSSAASSLVATPGVNSASVTFTTGSTNGSGSIDKIQYSLDGSSTWIDLSGTFNDVSGSGTIPLPYRGSAYTVAIRQRTPYGGFSGSSNSVSVSPYSNTTPSAPSSLVATPGVNSASVTFTTGSTNGSGSIDKIQYSLDGSSTWIDLSGTFNDVSGSGTIPLPYRGTAYTVAIRQRTPYGGFSGSSNSVSVSPYSNTTPSAPSSLVATPGVNSASVTFTCGSTNGSGSIDKIQYSIDGSSTWIDLSGTFNDVSGSGTIPLPYRGSAYTIAIRQRTPYGGFSGSSNSVSVSPYSNTTSSAPSSLVATPGVNSALVTFTCGSTNGSGSIDKIQYSIDGSSTWIDLSGTFNDVSGSGTIPLPYRGSAYTIAIRQRTPYGGFSGSSNSVSVSPYSNTTSSAPSSLVATPGVNSASVTFTTGSTNGSGSIDKIQYSLDGSSTWIDLSGTFNDVSGSGTIPLPYRGSAYTVAIRQRTPYGGFSGSSNSVSVSPYSNTTPSASSSLAATPGVNSASVTFTTGSTNGSGSIDKIQYSLDGSSTWIDLSGTFNDVSGSGTIPLPYRGSAYTVAIRQRTPYGGFSGSSNSVSVSPYSNTTPSAPSSLVATPGVNSASVTFTTGNTNGSGSIDKIQYSLDGSSTWIDLSGTFNDVSGSGTIPLPYRGSAYTVAIRQRTPYGGFSGSSNSVSVSPYSNTTPSAPSSLVATPGVNSASVTFICGSTNGSGSIDKIQYSLDGSSTWIDLSGTFNDVSGSGTIPLSYRGSAYTVVIRQRTPYGGFSGSSNSVSVSPNGVLLPPTISSTEIVSKQITVNFTDASSNTGKGVLGYKYSYDEGATYTTLAANATQFVLSNMTLPSYTIWLKTYNALSESSYVETVVTMNTTIVPPTITSVVPGNLQVQVFFTPGDINSLTLTGYKYSTNGTTYTWANETTSPLVITGLSAGTAYTITIKGVYSNAETSIASNVSNSVTPYGIPYAPTIVNITPGDGAASVYYTDGSSNGSPVTMHQYSLNGDDYIDVSYASPIQLTGLTNGNPYVIDVKSVNAAGQSVSSNSMAFIPYTVPSKPIILNVIPLNNKAGVYIQHGNDNGSDITLYSYSVNNAAFVSTGNANTCFDISGLTNGTSYTIRVIATNAAGNSAVSEPYQVTPVGVPEAPTNLETTPISDGVSISFTDGASNGRPITYYLYSLNGGEDIPIQKNSEGVIHIFDLLNITNYSLRLRAVNNAGLSSYSTPVTWTTQFDQPLVPFITQIIPGDGVAYLHFDESITTGSPIEQFYYSLNGLPSVPLISSSLTSPLTIPVLRNKHTYNISIIARNGGNYSNVSNTKSVNVGAPHAPVVTSVVPGSKNIRVYFDAPFDNGFPIIEYLYGLNEHAYIGKTKSLTDASGSYLYIPNLSNGRRYVVYICAININGMSARSNVLSPVVPASVPDKIKISKLTPSLYGSLVDFRPPINHGEPIIKYKYAFNSSTDFIDASGTTLPLAIYDTPINTPFSVKLIAVNKAGESIISEPSRTGIFVYLPPSQIRVHKLSMPTKNSLQVSFSSPAFNGSYITKYKYALNGSNDYIDASGTRLPLLITDGIEPNVDYNIQVIAVNSAFINDGESIPSIPLAKPIRYTYLEPENAPLVSSIVGKNSSAIVTFTAPKPRGAPIIGYAYSMDEDGLVYTDFTSEISSPLTITGLTNDTLYNIRIAAKTDAGYSPLSIAKPVTPVYKEPGAPMITTVVKGSYILTVYFAVPPENGSPITGYNYTLNSGEKIPVVLNPDGRSFVIMKNVVNGTDVLLTNGTRYSIRMTAINEVGESQNSPVKFGTPMYR